MGRQTKYYDGVDSDDLNRLRAEAEYFDMSGRISGYFSALKRSALGRGMPLLLRAARNFRPVFNLSGAAFVTRAADVKAILENHDVFEVPFGPEMKALAGEVTFGLGLDDEEHHRQRELMQKIAEPGDIDAVLANVRRTTKGLISDSNGRIDLMKGYITPLLTEACLTYFGLDCDDPDAFAEWGVAISDTLFADPGGTRLEDRKLAFAGAKRLNSVIDWSIARMERSPDPATLLGRMIGLRHSNETLNDGTVLSEFLTDARIRAILVGMVSGTVPTTTLAAGHAFEALLGQRGGLHMLREAASTDNRDRVRDIVLEAARLKPAGFPGHFRYVNRDFTLTGEGTTGHSFKKGDTVMVCTMSALSDPAFTDHPYEFRPGRIVDPAFMFGHGHHACLGRHLATEIMTEAFLQLFRLDNIRPKSRWQMMRAMGPFPYSYPMLFDPKSAPDGQSMMTIAVPLDAGQAPEVAARLRDDLGNPAKGEISNALENTGVIHTASMTVVELMSGEERKPTLLIELNGDGTTESILNAVEQWASDALAPVLRLAGMPAGAGLSNWLASRVVDLKTRPWGMMGLNFNGVGEFSVRQIEEESRLYALARDIIEHTEPDPRENGNYAQQTLGLVRAYLRQDHRLFSEADSLEKAGDADSAARMRDWLRRGEELGHLLFRPAGRKVLLAGKHDRSALDALKALIGIRNAWKFYLPALIVLVILLIRIDFGLLLIALLAIGLLVGGAVALFLYNEARDEVDESNPDYDALRAIESSENDPRYRQNHITAVNELKKGWLRKLTLAGGFYAIALEVRYWFRPGYVVDIGTIRHAKWFRLAGTDNLVFQANYDGSWESYLEDFSNKAYQGQNAVWSNCVGYPRTKGLMQKGAYDGDRFKIWVRGKQVETQFWYCRFGELTNDNIRINALVRDGLARSRTNSGARAWLSYFGSMPHPVTAIETNEVQSFLFHGFKELDWSSCLALHFSDDPADRSALKTFVSKLIGRPQDGSADYREPLVAFGDVKHPDRACSFALSHSGLAKLGVPGLEGHQGLASFPQAYLSGMGRRGRILGDNGRNGNVNWLWADSWDDGAGDRIVTDAVLFVMGRTRKQHEMLLRNVEALLGEAIDVVHRVDCAFVRKNKTGRPDKTIEHFGFRDGISQPVMRGTQRHARGACDANTVNPGEFILGYQDNKELFAPSPHLLEYNDPAQELPLPADMLPERFADFSDRRSDKRDLGRNGSFLVIRELQQDVEGFWENARVKAEKVAEERPDLGGDIDADWIAAKIIGRWKSGAPLVREPKRSDVDSDENDFLYGRDDAQGLRCPHGSHIRRSNPRESFNPGSQASLDIANRHRILRRGRPYIRDEGGEDEEKGLLFCCFNANIERQFEFVQQSWVNAPTFHGLRREPDPLMDPVGKGSFTIPTSNGPVQLNDMQTYVTMKGGGYFFMPGRATLRYLGI